MNIYSGFILDDRLEMKSLWRELRRRLGIALDTQRLRISRAEALPQFAILGILCGLLAALVMIAFRVVIEMAQGALLPPGGPENYEDLAVAARFIFPMVGVLIIAALFHRLSDATRNVGPVHVLERLAYHQGRLPLKSAIVQFISGAAAIIAGLSVGREGPAIHLGAASASLVGQHLRLPNNSLRILVGCGVAAAIAASFNTPLAGVAFAMEVVLMEYTVIGFAPVILAAVSATAVTHVAYGSAMAFSVPPVVLKSVWELPYVLGMGLIIGMLAAAFIAIVDNTARRTRSWSFWTRALLVGALTGLCAWPAPQIMGVGYDTVGSTLLGQVAISVLLAVIVFKLLATGLTIGMGIPGGLIGPLVVIGAAAGSALGVFGQWVAPETVSSPALYALIGLGAMMAGTLHAPLAALTAMLELTGNPHIIWPGMLAVIAAYGVSRVVFGQQPIFITLMRARGLDYRHDPIVQSLRRVGVGAVMDASVAALPRQATRAAIDAALAPNPNWILVINKDKPTAILPAKDLARQMLEAADAGDLDLLEVPADRLQVAPVALQATLQEALDALDSTGAEALYVVRPSAWDGVPDYGIITRADIDKSYSYGA
jgi:chloride channel protein, CIC family